MKNKQAIVILAIAVACLFYTFLAIHWMSERLDKIEAKPCGWYTSSK